MIQGHDRALIFTSTKEACLAACLNEVTNVYNRFILFYFIEISKINTTKLSHVSSQLFIFQKNFICRSAEYNYVTLQCRLSDYDRRSVTDNFKSVQLVEAQGVDYFENLCLSSKSLYN